MKLTMTPKINEHKETEIGKAKRQIWLEYDFSVYVKI